MTMFKSVILVMITTMTSVFTDALLQEKQGSILDRHCPHVHSLRLGKFYHILQKLKLGKGRQVPKVTDLVGGRTRIPI